MNNLEAEYISTVPLVRLTSFKNTKYAIQLQHKKTIMHWQGSRLKRDP